MDFEINLLENYFKVNPMAMKSISHHLDVMDGWKHIILELRKFRIPVYLNQEVVERSTSPSTYLINELITRSCTVIDFKEILTNCNLLNALTFLEEPEPPEIIVQPGEDYEQIFVYFGEDLRLECTATGKPPPIYQWFRDNIPLTGYNSSVMVMPDFREDSEGEYYCVVTQHTNDCVIEVTSNVIVCTIQSLPEFIQNLQPKTLAQIGGETKLEVEIFCRSKYKIEWIKKNQILEDENDCILILRNINKSDEGVYRCVARNLSGEVYSNECHLIVVPEKKRKKASAKVALLIANSKYNNFVPLQTPIEDCLLLAEKLEKINFHVITLIDLTLHEMHYYINWFFENLPPKAYAFVCYIGHGFSIANNKFMMPVDCPKDNEYRMSDCILDELLVKKSVESKLKLLVLVLDMCLKEPNRDVSAVYADRVPDYSYTPNSKFSKVQAFATSNHQGAYECPNMRHGFYIAHICKYLESDKPVIQVFDHAHQEFLKYKVVELQKPSLSYSADIKFKLTDPLEENFIANETLSPFIHVKENLTYKNEMYFPEINLNTTLFATPHRKRILNAIDLKFKKNVSKKYTITAFISPEVLAYDWSTCDKHDSLVLYNIQKVKTNIYITIHLTEINGHDDNTAAIDNVIDLGLPLIASTNHWLKMKNSTI